MPPFRPNAGASDPTMASRRHEADPARPTTRLYLATPRLKETADFAPALDAALDAGDVAAVLLRLEDADESTLIARVRTFAPVAQSRGAALLLDNRPDLVVRSGADGAHLDGIAALRASLANLKPAFIAGAGRLGTRHDAMLAAEAGADYVMFGEPDAAGRRPSLAAILERVAWWAEVFEVPCVGYAASLDEVAGLAAAHADFVALGAFVFADARGAAAAVSEAQAHLATSEEAA
jgi:thiamine-phosphate pyrophosphorylase